MNRILILGGSGFIGNALYKELAPFFDVHATYKTDNPIFEKNKHFHQFDYEMERLHILLDNLKPKFIVTALRGNVTSLVRLHFEIADYVEKNDCKVIFLSSANVFDRFTNYPSYEYDKTLSESIYGRFKIKIENELLRKPISKYVICRIPMIYGAGSPRINEIKAQLQMNEAIEVFSNVVINATHINKLVQQLHYIINRRRRGIFHLGSNNLIHHIDLIKDICEELGHPDALIKQVFDSNEDRHLAVLPKDNMLPKHLQLTIEDVVKSSVVL
ncbi:dTDP-4-dehydrorhamnose reductase [Nonlabens dokdonensis]|uniref:dTDP-4-dehydrorhamnose reductase-like protein n=2 Tax=Nonlabens dokdonensis TaxID=328515 RepID=L7WA83_NONDD|nr:sugar nucleotide-binding protein [Nonlabens dokdonensis]AGC78590.1 DTDP-4-dehydrorhamnose reductase-like protein [Nonlabens dokdonensis DSW-6]PZX39280.1 dTDP-4-dehydrorhamnose reductase [Nonlabens dokdonensis]